MRALVTGCAGFIGSHLSEHMVDLGHEVIGVDCFTDYYDRRIKEANLNRLRDESRFRLVEIDLADAPLDALTEGVDVIFHLAGQPGVRASWGHHFDGYVRNNIVATQRLLEAVKHKPIKKLVYASSSSVYGDAEAYPTAESTVPQPVSPYGVTKLSAEQLVYLYWRNDGLPTISLRYFSVYGPRQRPDMGFHRFIQAAIEHRAIQVFGDGEQTRDFTYVGDIVAANVSAALCESCGMALNVGGGSEISINATLAMISSLLEQPIDIEYRATERGDVRHTAADTSLASRHLGYKPITTLADGLQRETEWVLQALRTGVLHSAPSTPTTRLSFASRYA
jgi:nucleoside-diphosphate-sugar epimerase